MTGKKVSQLTPYAVLRESDEIVINDNSVPPITKKTTLKELSDFVLAGQNVETSAVTRIIAGENIEIDPTNGLGNVIVRAVDTGLTDLTQDTTPALGGDLDLNGFDIDGTGNISCSAFTSSNGNSFDFGKGNNTEYTIRFPGPSGSPFELKHTFGLNGLEFRGPYTFGSEYRRDIFLGTSGTPSEFKNVMPVETSEYNFGASDKRWKSVHTDKAFVHSTLQLQPYYSAVGTPVGSKIEFDQTGNNCIYSTNNTTAGSLNIEGYTASFNSQLQLGLFANNSSTSTSAWIQLNRTDNRVEFSTNGTERAYIDNDRMHLHHMLQLMSLSSLPSSGSSGDMCNVNNKLYFHNGTEWLEVYLYGQGSAPTPPDPIDWANVLSRATFDTDLDMISGVTSGFTLGSTGSPAVDTNNKQFGSGSAFFNQTVDTVTYDFTSNMPVTYDYTLEFWWRASNGADFEGNIAVIDNVVAADSITVSVTASKQLEVHRDSTRILQQDIGSIPDQFNHIALVRDATNTRLYLNGSSVDSDSTYTNSFDISKFILGGGAGWMDDFRFTIDARYTGSSFTPPQQALPVS